MKSKERRERREDAGSNTPTYLVSRVGKPAQAVNDIPGRPPPTAFRVKAFADDLQIGPWRAPFEDQLINPNLTL